MVEVLLAIVLGVGFGVVLARLLLGGLLAVAFRQAKTFVKRVAERRRMAEVVAAERRHDERRVKV